ncbi:MAG: nuclear transport factor 2 family protein [Undibacterium sp.]|nr:nuclear transport factor 2 family protein [Undibacterium sp.]
MENPISSEILVREFWHLMASNDFFSVKKILADDLIVEWPQSKERIRGSDKFARMNSEYPTTGIWTFQINRLVASGDSVVTQVSVSDGTQSAEPVSFFTIENGKITGITEYWPDPFEAQENRRHLTESMG